MGLACLGSHVTSLANRFPRNFAPGPTGVFWQAGLPFSLLSFNPEVHFLVQIADPATLEHSKCARTCRDVLLCESGGSPVQRQAKQVGTQRNAARHLSRGAPRTTTGRGQMKRGHAPPLLGTGGKNKTSKKKVPLFLAARVQSCVGCGKIAVK